MTIAFTDIINNYRRYGPASSTHDLLKAAAIIIMIIDHIGHYFFPEMLWLRTVGRLGTPVWFFFAGYAKPSRTPWILIQLAVLMMLTDLITHSSVLPFNTLVSVIMCRYFVTTQVVTQPPSPSNLFFAVFVALIFWPVAVFLFEYNSVALLFAIAGYYCRNYGQTILSLAALTIAGIFFIVMQIINFHFTVWQGLFLIPPTIFFCVVLYRMKGETFHSIGILSKPVNFFSRNSHYLYAVHVIIFQLIACFVLGRHL